MIKAEPKMNIQNERTSHRKWAEDTATLIPSVSEQVASH